MRWRLVRNDSSAQGWGSPLSRAVCGRGAGGEGPSPVRRRVSGAETGLLAVAAAGSPAQARGPATHALTHSRTHALTHSRTHDAPPGTLPDGASTIHRAIRPTAPGGR